MKAITEIGPWGFAIISLGKRVENRSWYPPENVIGQRIAIHQGKTLDERAVMELRRDHFGSPNTRDLVAGAVLGTVLLKGFVYVRKDGSHTHTSSLTPDDALDAMTSRWRNPGAKVLWVLEEPRALSKPVYCRGMQGLWTLPREVIETMAMQNDVVGGDARP